MWLLIHLVRSRSLPGQRPAQLSRMPLRLHSRLWSHTLLTHRVPSRLRRSCRICYMRAGMLSFLLRRFALAAGGAGSPLRHPEICFSLDLQPYSTHLPYSEHDSCPLLSILYKTKLPFIIVFNKTDVQPHDFALEWMQDFEVFQEALATHQSTTDDDGAPTYMNSLMNSMSLVLDEFYKHLKVGPRSFSFGLQDSLSQSVGVSSMTGDGVAEFFQAVEASREEYERSIPLCLSLPFGRLTCPTFYAQGISPRTCARTCTARSDTAETKRGLHGADAGRPRRGQGK
jgi:hypothetical protein